MPVPSLLSLHHVHLQRSGRTILQDVDLDIRAGEIVTLVGPNGGGKTSLLKVALGLLKPDHGQVARRQPLRVGYMPQQLHIDPAMPLTVERFLSLAGGRKADIAGALARVGAEHLREHALSGVSGGETQRVMLARALLRQPDLLVLDEPAQGVDLSGQQSLYRLLSALRDEHGCAILMVSHDLHLVMASSDRVVCLNQHVCCSGSAETVSRHPEYLALFGHDEAADIGVYTHHHDHRHDLHGNVVSGLDPHHRCSHD